MKKVLSLVLILAMALGMGATAFAADGDVTGGGDYLYAEEILKAELPTGELLKFLVDPQGLSTIESGDLLSDLAQGATGNIIAKQAAGLANQSNVPIKMTVQLTAVGSEVSDIVVPYGTDDETTLGAVASGTDRTVLLVAVPTANNPGMFASNTNLLSATATNTFTPSTVGQVITDNASTMTFILDKADFVVTSTDTDANGSDDTVLQDLKPDTVNSTGIQIGGLVNAKADWGTYAKKSDGTPATDNIGVTAVFAYTKAGSTDLDAEGAVPEAVAGTFALATATDLISLDGSGSTPAGPGFPGKTKTLDVSDEIGSATTYMIPFNWGGDYKIARFATASGTALVGVTDYTWSADGINLTAARVTKFKSLTAPAVFVITLNDPDATEYTLTVQP